MLQVTIAEIDVQDVEDHGRLTQRDRFADHLAMAEQAVVHRLWHSGRCQLHKVKCRCSRIDGNQTLATLSGQLTSYHLKQVAQELVRGVAVIDLVENQIEVLDSSSSHR